VTAPQSANPNRRALIILAIGLAAALLFFLVTQVLGGDDGADEVVGPETTTTITRAPVTTVAPAAGVPGAEPVETFEVFSTKNPFVPLRGATAATATGGTTTGTGTTGTGTTGTGTTGTTTTGSATAGTSTATGGTSTGSAAGSGSTEPRRSQRVSLLDVFAEGGRTVANVRVNDRVHKVGEGDTFATSFQVLSLSQADSCGQSLFGDDPFRLCEGEELLK